MHADVREAVQGVEKSCVVDCGGVGSGVCFAGWEGGGVGEGVGDEEEAVAGL